MITQRPAWPLAGCGVDGLALAFVARDWGVGVVELGHAAMVGEFARALPRLHAPLRAVTLAS